MIRRSLAAVLFTSLVATTGCGDTSVTYVVVSPFPSASAISSPTPTPATTATPSVTMSPSPIPAQSPFSQTTTVSPVNNTVTFPSVSGYAAALSFGAGSLPNGVTVTGTVTDGAPSGVAPLTRRAATMSFASNALLYVGLDFSMSTSASGPIVVTTTVPTGVVPSGYQLWLGLMDPTVTPAAWQYGIAGPSQLSDGSVSFTIASGYGFVASQQYWLAAYALPANFATPAPIPAALTVNPTSLSLSGTGAAHAAQVSIIEPNYKGNFFISSGNAAIATVSNIVLPGPSSSFIVTPAGGGSTKITIADQNGQTAQVSVGVTTGTVIGNGVHHE